MATISVLNTDTQLSGKTVVTAEGDWTITGQWSFNRSPSAPFVVQAGSAKVTNLDADKLDGSDWAAVATNILPDADNTRDLGSASFRFAHIYGASFIGLTLDNATCGGRLTATTAVPVTTGDVSGATSVFFTPYTSNRIALYDGSSAWNVRTFSEITISLVGLTASKPYDIFAYDNAGTVTIETLVWTSTTARATALVYQDGVLVKTGATTRRYVGTVYINASGGQTDDTFAKRYIFNMYNRVRRSLRRVEGTDTWTYTTSAWRQANGSAANQVECMIGVIGESVSVRVISMSANSSANLYRITGIGEDGVTAPVAGSFVAQIGNVSGANQIIQINAEHVSSPAVGLHYWTWLEYAQASGTATWYGDNGDATLIQSGMIGQVVQ